ncbi:AH receptor-interacting protein [Aphelenchoides fujianensis]|nr:AH receptor-interacting protein [Aphelenchoides fujianensis]
MSTSPGIDGTKAFFHYEVLKPLVDVNAEGFPEDRSLYKSIDDTRKKWPDGYGKALELVFGKKFQLPVFETCIRSMHENEISQFDIDAHLMATYPMVAKKLRDIGRADVDPKFDFHSSQQHHCAAMGPLKTGYECLDDLIKNPTPLRVVFHLLEVQQAGQYTADSWQLNEGEKLERVEKLKEDGNTAFRKGEQKEAIAKYKEALGLLDQLLMLEKPGDVEWKELDQKNLPLHLNLAQCFLNERKFHEAAESASEALKRDETNEKALFRRAKARIGMWELNAAEEDLKRLLEHHPQNEKLVQQQREVIKTKRAEKEKDEKSVYKKMMAS